MFICLTNIICMIFLVGHFNFEILDSIIGSYITCGIVIIMTDIDQQRSVSDIYLLNKIPFH